MATISIVARPSKRNDGRRGIYARVEHGKKTRYVSLGLLVRTSEWNANAGRVRKGHEDFRRVNAYLAEVEAEAENVVMELVTSGQAITAARIKAGLKAELREEAPEDDPVEAPGPACFLAYCEEMLATWQGRWAYQTFLAYRTAVRKLRAYVSKGSDGRGRRGRAAAASVALPFEEITPAMLRRFQEHLATPKPAGLGNKPNTIHKNLSTLKEFYRQAMEEEVIPWGRNPFDSLRLTKQDAIKEKLTTEELIRIKDLELEEGLMADVRRWFLFAFYAGGMRFTDVAEMQRRHLRYEEGAWRSFYRMGKTKGLHGVPIIPEAMDILDHYGWREKKRGDRIFPILDGYDLSTQQLRRQAISTRNALVNKYLRKLQRRAGIETNISFHLSRHSVAGYLLEQGYDVLTIQQVLGHESARVTEHYLKGFKSRSPDAAARSLSL